MNIALTKHFLHSRGRLCYPLTDSLINHELRPYSPNATTTQKFPFPCCSSGRKHTPTLICRHRGEEAGCNSSAGRASGSDKLNTTISPAKPRLMGSACAFPCVEQAASCRAWLWMIGNADSCLAARTRLKEAMNASRNCASE